jgi:hypothetical protein
MHLLAENLLNAAGFRHDEIEGTWIPSVRLHPVVTVECEEDGASIMETLLEVHAILDTAGCTYNNVAIGDGFVSLVGLAGARLAAVA